MGDQHVKAEQEDEHGRAVFQVPVQLSYDPAEPKQSDHLQRAEETSNALNVKHKTRYFMQKYDIFVLKMESKLVAWKTVSLTHTKKKNKGGWRDKVESLGFDDGKCCVVYLH